MGLLFEGAPAGRRRCARNGHCALPRAQIHASLTPKQDMPALFPKWSDSLLRASSVALVVAAVALPTFAMIWVRTPFVSGKGDPVRQPIEFDHRHHVADDGIDCRYCHDLVERSRYAGVPPTSRCLNCHNQIWNDSPLLATVWTRYFRDQPIPWVRVHRLPDFVYFDHSIHVNKGVGCESCHGRVDRMARVYQIAPLSMSWCLDCHRSPERHLRPPDAITAMGWTPPRPQEEFGRALKTLYGVREITHCSACHR